MGFDGRKTGIKRQAHRLQNRGFPAFQTAAKYSNILSQSTNMAKSTYKSTVIITGGTAGLGYGAALSLAKQLPDHQIIVASRSNKDDAATKINKSLKQSNTIYLPLDLFSPDSITSFANNVSNTYPTISHLVLNAGLQFGKVETIDYFPGDGIEKTFGINHVGHVHLFHVLLPHLTSNAHIVVVSSGTHDPAQKTMMPLPDFTSAETVARGGDKTNPSGQQRYSTSKLCNVLWTYALDRKIKLEGKTIKVNAFDPGLMMDTGLPRDYPWVLQLLWNHVLGNMLPVMRLLTGSQNVHKSKDSGASLARLAIGEDVGVKGVSAKYFEGRKAIESSVESHEQVKQDDLWDWTLRYLVRGDEGKRVRWEKLQG